MDVFTDKSFNKDFTQHYVLLVEIQKQQLGLCLFDKGAGKIAVLKRIDLYPKNNELNLIALKNTINQEDTLHAAVQEIKIALAFTPFTLIPRLLFDDYTATEYMKIAAPQNPDDVTVVNYIKRLFIKNVFTVPTDIKKYFNEEFNAPKIFHTSTALIEWGIHYKEEFAEQQILLDVQASGMYIVYFTKREFRYINYFTFQNKDDFMYFILLVCEQFKIDRNLCDLKLSGSIVPDAQLFAELWKFFKNISFSHVPEQFSIPEELEHWPMHSYTSLMSLQLCE